MITCDYCGKSQKDNQFRLPGGRKCKSCYNKGNSILIKPIVKIIPVEQIKEEKECFCSRILAKYNLDFEELELVIQAGIEVLSKG